MFNDEQEQLITQSTRTIQIIAFALIMGVVMFSGVIVAAGMAAEEPPETPLISLIGIGFALMCFIAALVVPSLMMKGMRKSVMEGKPLNTQQPQYHSEAVGEVGPLLGVFTTKEIVWRALLEGPAFLNLIAYMLEAQDFSLAIVGALVLTMLVTFPSRDKVERFVRDELRTLEQMRRLER